VLRDYPALFKHSTSVSEQSQSSRSSKFKFKQLARNLQSWFLVSETCLLKDTACFKAVIFVFAKEQLDCDNCHIDHVDSAKEQLLALKDEPGNTLVKFWK